MLKSSFPICSRIGIISLELHELIIEGQSYFHGEASHDVLDKVLSEGDDVKVLHVLMISRLACRFLILGARSLATS